MASFTDQIMQSRPYVQQLPLDEMAKVGMYKQQKYEEGVQKIQSEIDRVGGLNVSRNVDKQYLQSKLNELGSKLKTVAAGDFSNFQLVNSVGGMANQIVKDPYVSAAVYSSANDDAQLKRMAEDEKAGKLTPHAKYVYELKRSAYFNNPNLTDENGKPIKFSGQYIASWDLDKALLEAVGKVGDREWIGQNPFKTDPTTGRILYNTKKIKDPKTGKIIEVNDGPVLSEYAVQQKRKGKFNENIAAAIDSVLMRPEAQQELMMRGIYDYRNYNDVNDFVRAYQKEKEDGIVLLEQQKINLLSKATLETNPEKKAVLEAMVDDTDDKIKNLKNYEDPRIKQALESKSLDGYKTMLYTQRERNNYLRAFVTEDESREYVESVPWKSHQDAIKAERDWWKSQEDVNQGWANVRLRREELNQKKEEWKYDPKNPNAQINQGKPYEKGALAGELYDNWINRGSEVSDAYNNSKRNFVIDYLKAINYSNGRDLSDEEIIRSAERFEKQAPGYFEREFQRAMSAVQENPSNSAFSNLITSVPGLKDLEKKVENYAREVDEVNNDPEVLNVTGGKKLSDFEKKFKTVKFGNITLTPKDQVNLATIVGTSNKVLKDRAEQELMASTGKSSFQLLPIVGQLAPKRGAIGGLLLGEAPWAYSTEQREAKQKMGEYLNVLGTDVVNAKESVLKRKMKGDSPVAFEIYPDGADSKVKSSIDQRLKTVLSDKLAADEDVSKYAGFYSGSDADRSKYTVNIGVNRGGAFGGEPTITLDLFDGNDLVKSLNISKKDAEYIRMAPMNVPAGVSDAVRRINWNEETKSTNSKTSDPNNPSAYKTAYYPGSDFYRLQRPNILGADIKVNDLGQPNVYFYVKDQGGRVKGVPFKTSPFDILPAGFTSIDAADTFIKSISRPSEIDNILKNANIK